MNMNLLDMMAKACHYAQDHVRCDDAWPQDEESRTHFFTCVSYQMACFLAQNTIEGRYGVECDIVLDKLISKLKTENQWKRIIKQLVDELGGWKSTKPKLKAYKLSGRKKITKRR